MQAAPEQLRVERMRSWGGMQCEGRPEHVYASGMRNVWGSSCSSGTHSTMCLHASAQHHAPVLVFTYAMPCMLPRPPSLSPLHLRATPLPCHMHAPRLPSCSNSCCGALAFAASLCLLHHCAAACCSASSLSLCRCKLHFCCHNFCITLCTTTQPCLHHLHCPAVHHPAPALPPANPAFLLLPAVTARLFCRSRSMPGAECG